ncbi:TPA: hypothetical protein KPJ62_003885 [Clostridioides difficile]|nr:hypothetical protein [Clostridioides difficile]
MDLFMKEIEDPRYKNLIEITVSHINEICVYGQYLFNLMNTDKDNKKSDAVILFLFRDLLETVDGIQSLFKGSSINISDMLFRNMFELSLSLDYIFLDEELLEKRALSYEVTNIHEKITLYEKFNTDNAEYENFREIIGEDIYNIFTPEKLNSLAENLRSVFEKYPEYKSVDEDRTRKKDAINLKRRKRHLRDLEPKWYQIHSTASNLRGLSKLLNMEKYYLILYSEWSKKLHGLASMEALKSVNNKPFVQNPKVPKNPQDVIMKIELIRSLMTSCYINICKYFLTDEDFENLAIWYRGIKEKESDISKKWSKIIILK